MKPLILVLLLSGAIQAKARSQKPGPGAKVLLLRLGRSAETPGAFQKCPDLPQPRIFIKYSTEKSKRPPRRLKSAKPAAKPVAASEARAPVDPVTKWNEDVRTAGDHRRTPGSGKSDVLKKLNQWLNQSMHRLPDPQTRSDAQTHI